MPNYLDQTLEGAFEVDNSKDPYRPVLDNDEKVNEVDARLGGLPSAQGFFPAQGSGSKPQALHTEYAAGDADWSEAYHGDLVFYLVRADGGETDPDSYTEEADGDDTELAGRGIPGAEQGSFTNPSSIGSLNGGTGSTNAARSGVNIQTGPRSIRSVQTAVSQVAVGHFLKKNVSDKIKAPPALAGPMTGIHREITIPPNVKTQASAARSTIQQSVRNLTNIVDSLDSNVILRSLPASETFFYNSLHSSFSPNEITNEVRSPEQIAKTLTRGAVGELCFYLAEASDGIRSTRNLIQAINKGDLGYTCASSMVQSERYGPMGKERRYSR